VDPNQVEVINGFNRLAVYSDGFDSHRRPINSKRCPNWSYTANRTEFNVKTARLGPQMDPSDIVRDAVWWDRGT